MNENTKSALLIMDVQEAILGRVQSKDEFLAKTNAAIDAAHKKNIQVIYVVVGFREGMPEANESQRQFAGSLVNPTPAITPTGTDIVVIKRRVSAFSGSDLGVILSAQNIRHLVLGGIATSGVVLSTVREAADKDFKMTVLSDLCADMDPEVHNVLLTKILTRQATVMTSDEWMKM